MRPKNTLTGLLAVAVLTVSLAGCSVDVVDGSASSDGNGASGSSSATDTGTTDAGTTENVDTEDAETEDGDTDFEFDLTRDDLIAAATRTMKCDGDLTLLDNAMSTQVEGWCESLILNTTDSQIVADDVRTLKVIGDGNVVFVGSVETLVVNGEGNVVIWTGDTPRITDVGSTNVLKAE